MTCFIVRCNDESQLQNVFYAAGAGTTMNLNNTNIHDIPQPSGVWSGITYAQGATGTVKDSQFSRNNGVLVRMKKYFTSMLSFIPHLLTCSLFDAAVWNQRRGRQHSHSGWKHP